MIFLRHPVTDAPEGLCYGRHDVGHGPEAEAQMVRALAQIPRPTAIMTSPLRRCRLMADRFAARDGLNVREDARLIEYDFGDWEGRLWADIPRCQSDLWLEDLLNAAPPGGENFQTLIDRVHEALADIAPGTLVICHAGPIRAAQMILTGASFEEVFARKVPFCEPLCFARERV